MVISNEFGGDGAELLNKGNRHWFCINFEKYNRNESSLQFDQHMVVALIAPRPVYIASAELDKGADPYGKFLTAKAANPVYRFLGTEEFFADTFPALHQPVFGGIGHRIRAGNHDVTKYDWEQYIHSPASISNESDQKPTRKPNKLTDKTIVP
ncbi:MAG: acetyl xylan esterase [Segetibacter sp.]|nr:acetyl xylan esterase [Segetibacter sp.]